MRLLEQVSFAEGAETNTNRSCALITTLITSTQMNASTGALFHVLPSYHIFTKCSWMII